MDVDSTADSMLEMNQPFGEFIKRFPSEEHALAYYKSYVARCNHSLFNEPSEVDCRIVWKKFMSRKRRKILDIIVRYYLPSVGWKDLTFETTHQLSRATYTGIRRKLLTGRIGRIVCLAVGLNAVCAMGGIGRFLVEDYAELSTDPGYVPVLLGIIFGTAVLLIGCVVMYPLFKRMSEPDKLSHISRGFFVASAIKEI